MSIWDNPYDSMDQAGNAWLPYLGLLISHGDTDSNLAVAMLGFPILFGQIDRKGAGGTAEGRVFRESSGSFESGYFFEASAEYSANVPGGSAGLFMGYSVIHAAGSADTDESMVGVGPTASQSYDFGLTRQVWVLGARFTLGFASPL